MITWTESSIIQYVTWSLILWDYLITLDDEITLFWFSRRSWIKFLFFANRYMGLVLRIWDIIEEHLNHTDDPMGFYNPCRRVMREEAHKACAVGTESGSVLYVTLQLLVIESILVLRVWAIMAKRRQILWTFFGLLACTMAVSIVLNLSFLIDTLYMPTPSLRYVIPTLIFEAIIFTAAAYHGFKVSGDMKSLLSLSKGPFQHGPKPIMRLIFQGSVLYFMSVLCSLPLMALVDPRLGLTIMSVTMTHMLLRLRKEGLSNSDSVGSSSQEVELTTFRATTNAAMSLESGRNVINIGPFPQGS
ncbi:hypothetical protein EV421DRAFT_1496149 [Armillaria borealis]|uniref:DUF6533 domain-containing protein n=1 Tax=Armillaria borealis TaxID=47425 RepID=A0AA39IY69_9AGAR|nr:hypothetical protein EV421DRAFT_1496149 [Armillaria borealis]